MIITEIQPKSNSKQSTDVFAFLTWLHDPGDVFEVRVLKCPDERGGKWNATVAGWFDDKKIAAKAIESIEARKPPAVYVTLNPVQSALLARSSNKLVERADTTTSDKDIERRRWLFIDIDPVRPAKISSTAGELRHAQNLAQSIRDELHALGWSEPLKGMSGNGCYLLYRIDLPNDQTATELVVRVLAKLAERCNNSEVQVDTTGSNAARIIKVLGTVARKGDDFQAKDKPVDEHRPHRRSWFTIPPTMPQVVTRCQLEQFAGVDAVEPEPKTKQPKFASHDWSIEKWLHENNVPVGQPKPWNGTGRRWVFTDQPPLCDHDVDGSGFIVQSGDGILGAGCQHNHCTWGWRELRQHYEPGCYGNDAVQAKTTPAVSSNWISDQNNHTDNFLSWRFIDAYGENLRFVPKWNKWLSWDGKRWKIDTRDKLVTQMARGFTDGLWKQLSEVAKTVDGADIKKIVTFLKRSNEQHRIASMLMLASADERVLIEHDELNKDPMLLNLRNGTLDLTTGKLREHRQDDLITQLANVSFDASADCPKWLETLSLIFDNDVELIRYVQQIFGYSMSGDTGEHILPIAYGEGRNGKSTLWNAIIELAGDYGSVAMESLIMEGRNEHATEKAALYQKRIVAISEPEQGAKLRESRIKEMTGDSFITARGMREDPWTFRRTHTFWLSTNHRPQVTGSDEGIWRRIKLIPFEVDLRDKVQPIPDFHNWLVKHEGSGILNWLVAGALDRQANGFSEPECVLKSVADYRNEEDHLGTFVGDSCLVGPGYMVTASQAYDAYRDWGGKWSVTAFGREMANRFEKDKPTAGAFRKQTVYHGVGLVEK